VNVKGNEVCKIAKNAVGKYVYYKLEYSFPLLYFMVNTVLTSALEFLSSLSY